MPAGRVERGETLIQAAKREVLEEAGLVFAPKRVVGIEGSSPGLVYNVYLSSKILSQLFNFDFIKIETNGTLQKVLPLEIDKLQLDENKFHWRGYRRRA